MHGGLPRIVEGNRRILEINGGRVSGESLVRFSIPGGASGYVDAQLDDYGLARSFRHIPGVSFFLRARFSHPAEVLRGTAGFGFWNAPYGDPSQRQLSVPQAAWFFFASPPNDLPFAPGSPGSGWFAATIDAGTRTALAMIPLAPFLLVMNQISPIRRRIWPAIQRNLGIAHTPLRIDMSAWHEYGLKWRPDGCEFTVDGKSTLTTPTSPRGPLGFVCWLDNQYLILTPRGRFRSGIIDLPDPQWMEINDLQISYSN
jgi:hypothetical protein